MARRRQPALARLGAEIARVRLAAGLSQQALADALKVHRTTVARWETGLAPVGGEDLARLEDLLGVRVVLVPASAVR